MIRRLDHVAIAVVDTERALSYFSGHLGLAVVATDVVAQAHVKLTYLDAGNAFIQLVEQLEPSGAIARHIVEHGEGLHHVCFGVDDVLADAAELGEGEVSRGSGRGRASAFVPGPVRFGVPVECTQFNFEEDVHGNRGWLDG